MLKSSQELLEEALGSSSLEGQKPSVCFLRKKRKLEDSIGPSMTDFYATISYRRYLQQQVALSAHHKICPRRFR